MKRIITYIIFCCTMLPAIAQVPYSMGYLSGNNVTAGENTYSYNGDVIVGTHQSALGGYALAGMKYNILYHCCPVNRKVNCIF